MCNEGFVCEHGGYYAPWTRSECDANVTCVRAPPAPPQSPSPTPPPAPPTSPPGPPGAVEVVRTELTAEGSPDDYDDARKRGIAEAFAAEVDGVDADDVCVTVVAASVKIIVDVPVPTAAAASDVAAALAPKFATTDAASTFLADASVAVVSVDAPPAAAAVVVSPSAPPSPPPPRAPPSPPPRLPPPWGPDLQMCCQAMTLSCLACKEGVTEEEYCAANAFSEWCPLSTPLLLIIIASAVGVVCCCAVVAAACCIVRAKRAASKKSRPNTAATIRHQQYAQNFMGDGTPPPEMFPSGGGRRPSAPIKVSSLPPPLKGTLPPTGPLADSIRDSIREEGGGTSVTTSTTGLPEPHHHRKHRHHHHHHKHHHDHNWATESANVKETTHI